MSDPIRQLITVVPPETKAGSPTRTRGTQVLLPNGTKLGGVTRIELIGECNDIWRARIDCHVNVPRLAGLMLDRVNQFDPLSWWRRLLLRAAGVRAMDITPMDEEAFKRYAKV